MSKFREITVNHPGFNSFLSEYTDTDLLPIDKFCLTMSDLCVLTASLLVQGKTPGWKLAAPPSNFWAFTNLRSNVDRLCNSSSSPSTIPPTVALHRPEFSRQAKEVATHQSIKTHSPVKPNSNSQLYAQRVAALKAGHLYTRLPADSFQAVWQQVTYHPTYEDWIKLLTYEARAVNRGQGSQKMTVLLGDSIAQWFPSERLSQDRFWLNQGISGDTTTGVLKRLSILDQTNPSSIHVMVGINDLRQGLPNYEILKNIQLIIHRLHTSHPNAQIYIHSILPTRLENLSAYRIRRLNYKISTIAQQEGVHFVNLQPAFADAEGKLQYRLTTDGLHLNASGYRIWQLAMSPIL